ncbi:hypothetical protein BZM27_48235 [Paraburkholderia steynii]|uniref:Uncharacterized protein n=1 Tax=Paraburkholderia steynii TaxID=1245441 RepID=A0A4R0X4Z6_9BURK|nr:hypothetical protein BZM27_48235 [Paraburkholderia steynii]
MLIRGARVVRSRCFETLVANVETLTVPSIRHTVTRAPRRNASQRAGVRVDLIAHMPRDEPRAGNCGDACRLRDPTISRKRTEGTQRPVSIGHRGA